MVLNIVSVEAESGVSVASLIKTFYGLEQPEDVGFGSQFREAALDLQIGALTPLARMGFLTEISPKTRHEYSEYQYFKTPLWRKCFRLDTDDHIKPRLVQ